MNRNTNGWLIASGVLLIILGIICICCAKAALATMAIIAGAGFVIAAVADIMTFTTFGQLMLFSGWIIFDAIFDILLAILCFTNPLLIGAGLVWLGAIFVICVGIAQVSSAFQARRMQVDGWWGFLISGLVTVLFGALLIAYPTIFVILVGILMIAHGALAIAAGVRFNQLLR